jgi:hypothetical protein
MVIQLARGNRVSEPAAVELTRQGKTLRVGAEAYFAACERRIAGR